MSAAHSDPVRAILLRAIRIEARNGDIYDSFAQLFEGYDESVTAIFREMAAEERQHGAELEERYRERFGPVPPGWEEPKEVIEAPELEDAEAFIFNSMTLEQALQSGLRAELDAREYYRQQMSRTADAGLQQTYRELAEFEATHVRLLEEKLAQQRQTHFAGR
ncbi:MAG: ferritin family protein [Acidobacteria bacterium]|nr:ferritin family protein [Acidobacteriota bacterium]